MRELVDGALRTSALAAREGVWVLSGPLEVPARLAELLDARLRSAAPEELHALELLALAGGCGAAMVERLSGAGTVARLEEQGLVELRIDGRRRHVQPIHPLYAELLSSRLPRARAGQRSQELADALARCGARRRGDALLIATWSLDAGAEVAPELLLRGACEAYAFFETTLAERLAAGAWAAGSEPAAVVVARSLMRQARHAAVEEIVGPMHETAHAEPVRAELAELRADNLRRLGRSDAARAVIDGEAQLRDPVLRGRVAIAGAAIELFGDGTPSSTLRLVQPLLDPSSSLFPGAAVTAANALGDAARPHAALELLEQAEAVAVAGGAASGSWREDNVSPTRAHCLLIAGDLRAAQQEALSAYDRALTEQDTDGIPIYAALATLTTWTRGRVVTAARLAREGIAVNARASGRQDIGRWLFGLLALAEASAGHAVEAQQAVREGEELDALSTAPTSYDPEFVHRGRAWSAVAGGGFTEGRRLLEAAAAAARRHERYSLEIPLLYDIARIGFPATVADRLTELAGQVEAGLVQHLLAHVRALCRPTGAELEDAAERLASIGADLFAAEAFAAAAARHDKAALARRANACRHRMEVLLEQCEAARTPALAEATLPDRLTPRELEVATLAALLRHREAMAAAWWVGRRRAL